MNNSVRILVALAAAGTAIIVTGCGGTSNASPSPAGIESQVSLADYMVELSPSQVQSLQIGRVTMVPFAVDKEAPGSIDFDGDRSVQVFPPYAGKILQMFVHLGDDVRRGQPLYTIESPDLIQAESSLLAASASYQLTSSELKRVEGLRAINGGIPQRELDQATSDERTAEGSLKAARDAVRIFGKSNAEIDAIIASHTIDPALVVRSPLRGKITARNAQPGLYVQPGNPPAPYSVADVSVKWMLANVSESDIPLFHVGQSGEASVMAYPGREFGGKVSKIYATVDPNTHRETIRFQVADPANELRPGMLATFVIRVEEPVQSPAIPSDGVVREPDGTMSAWVTTDRRHFLQRTVKTGLRKDGQVQILAGLQPGQQVVTKGAVFLSNMLQETPTD